MACEKGQTAREDPLAEFPPIPYVEAYKPGIDRTLLIENLRLTPEERLRRGIAFARITCRIRGTACPAGES